MTIGYWKGGGRGANSRLPALLTFTFGTLMAQFGTRIGTPSRDAKVEQTHSLM